METIEFFNHKIAEQRALRAMYANSVNPFDLIAYNLCDEEIRHYEIAIKSLKNNNYGLQRISRG